MVIRQGAIEVQGSGCLTLGWASKGLRFLRFAGTDVSGSAKSTVPREFSRPLIEYFEGHDVDLNQIPVDPQGTPFQLRVWDELRSIPRGQVRSYFDVASALGDANAVRAVGMANSKNPIAIVVPCHRVIAKSRELGGYTGGLDRKRLLLHLEGIDVVDGKVPVGRV